MRFLLPSFCSLFILSACVHPADPLTGYRQSSAKQIYTQAHAALLKEKYTEATQGFEAMDSIYPFGPYSRIARLESIAAYYQNNQSDEALAATDQYLRLYPNDKALDYVYYMRGLILQNQSYSWLQKKWGVERSLRDLSDTESAFRSFAEVYKNYPHSKYATDALRHNNYLRNIMAHKHLLVAQLYYDRGAYVASANRISLLLAHFPESKDIFPGLILLAKNYKKLNLPSQYKQVLLLIKKHTSIQTPN